MKLLVLSCSTGEGHNSAARAVIEAARQRGIHCVLEDPVSFGGQRVKRAVANVYNNMIKDRPRMFGAVYRVGELFDRTGIASPVYFANAAYEKKLHEYLLAEGFDAVLCTHLYGMEAMAAVRRRDGYAIPCYGVLTDYTCIPFFGEPEMDRYFIAHEELHQELVEKGVPGERIEATGIPVSPRFGERVGRRQARESLGLPQASRVYLVMTGGVGCGDAGSLCAHLLAREAGDFQIVVLTGRNEEMRKELTEHFREMTQHLTLVPFTREVDRYMEAADVLLSKPGGLSSTEAAVCGVPLVHVAAIPGCETKNAAFFAAHGMALWAKDLADAAEKACTLVREKDMAARMLTCQRENIHADAAERIVETIRGSWAGAGGGKTL